ncbi:MAG: biotin/lipoyl-binding protein, partial [Cupriavidus sp.]|nr:biotin/lipoyl-binding protein [Cupriavidus sp.]
MNDTRASDATVEDKPVGASAPPGKAEAPDPSRKALKWVAALIVLSLTWYLLADRFTPYTQQARVQAFVIPVAAEVPGRVTRVYVRNNENVAAGTVLFDVDPQHYRIALDRARADL